MIERKLLEKLEFESEDIDHIIECDKRYGSKISPLSTEFMKIGKSENERRAFSSELVQKAVDAAHDFDNPYIIRLLFWLYCVPYAEEYYKENNISEEIFFDTMKDLSCKTRECKEVYGKTGIYYPYFYLHFGFVYFALGRLQFCIDKYAHDTYSSGGYVINNGDRIYSCHIPSGDRLTEEKCMQSLQRAYEFFKPELKGNILPVICTSWLLYPPYIECVFPKDSNMEKFTKLFDITGQYETGRRFTECERIFGVAFEGSTENFPRDNSLRRNMIEYMNSGRPSGHGIGIILYDGIKREIVR